MRLLLPTVLLAIAGCQGGSLGPGEADALCLRFFEIDRAIDTAVCRTDATGFRMLGLTAGRRLLLTSDEVIIGDVASPPRTVGYEIDWLGTGVIGSAAWLVTSDSVPVDFTRILIDSARFSGASGGDDIPAEATSLTYGTVQLEYKTKDGARSPVPVPPRATRCRFSFRKR